MIGLTTGPLVEAILQSSSFSLLSDASPVLLYTAEFRHARKQVGGDWKKGTGGQVRVMFAVEPVGWGE